jgi:hypothetical protein
MALIGVVVGGALVGGRWWEQDSPTPSALPTLAGPTAAGSPAVQPVSLVGRKLQPVRTALRRAGVQVTVRRELSEATRGTVLRIEPDRPVVPGSTVTLVVSDGNPRRG